MMHREAACGIDSATMHAPNPAHPAPLLGRDRPAVTLREVAERAGVSMITVSRAINAPQQVSERTRERVQEAVSALGYVPNRAARALASSRSNVIVVLVPSLSNAVFTAVLQGIQDAFDPYGYQILIGNTRYSD
eukprot:gene15928-33542_t